MCWDPAHHTGDARSIIGRRAVLIRCRAVNVDRPRCLCLRVVSSARHLCPCAAASSACMWKVRESSRCTPRCFTVFDGWITVPLIVTEGCVDGSCGRRLLQISQKSIRPDFPRSYGRFNWAPLCSRRSILSCSRRTAKGWAFDSCSTPSSRYEISLSLRYLGASSIACA